MRLMHRAVSAIILASLLAACGTPSSTILNGVFAAHKRLPAVHAVTARFEDLDKERGLLFVPDPKGGEERAFLLPLSNYLVDLLRCTPKRKRRRLAGRAVAMAGRQCDRTCHRA